MTLFFVIIKIKCHYPLNLRSHPLRVTEWRNLTRVSVPSPNLTRVSQHGVLDKTRSGSTCRCIVSLFSLSYCRGLSLASTLLNGRRLIGLVERAKLDHFSFSHDSRYLMNDNFGIRRKVDRFFAVGMKNWDIMCFANTLWVNDHTYTPFYNFFWLHCNLRTVVTTLTTVS